MTRMRFVLGVLAIWIMMVVAPPPAVANDTGPPVVETFERISPANQQDLAAPTTALAIDIAHIDANLNLAMIGAPTRASPAPANLGSAETLAGFASAMTGENYSVTIDPAHDRNTRSTSGAFLGAPSTSFTRSLGLSERWRLHSELAS